MVGVLGVLGVRAVGVGMVVGGGVVVVEVEVAGVEVLEVGGGFSVLWRSPRRSRHAMVAPPGV